MMVVVTALCFCMCMNTVLLLWFKSQVLTNLLSFVCNSIYCGISTFVVYLCDMLKLLHCFVIYDTEMGFSEVRVWNVV